MRHPVHPVRASSSRDITGRGRYGRLGIQPVDKEQVRVGTLLALRGAAACTAAQSQGIPWIVEQLQPQASEPAFFGLDEWIDLVASAGSTVFFHLSSLAPHARNHQPDRIARFGIVDSICILSGARRRSFVRPCRAATSISWEWCRTGVESCWCMVTCAIPFFQTSVAERTFVFGSPFGDRDGV